MKIISENGIDVTNSCCPVTGDIINLLDHGHVRYISHTPEDLVVAFARICYGGESKGDEADQKLINYLWRNKHTSPFEAPVVYFNIKMPIFVMRQYVRHRMQSLNEISARYTELPNEFYIPTEWRKQDTKNKQGSIETDLWNPEIMGTGLTATEQVRFVCNQAYDTYQALLQAGVAREMARMVLPLNIYTEIYARWDMKNLLHFVTLREDSHAQSEIVEFAKAIKTFLYRLYPKIMKAYDKYKFICEELQ